MGLRLEMERRIARVAADLGLVATGRPASELLRELYSNTQIDRQTASGVSDLMALANQAAHGANVTVSAALWALDEAPLILQVLDSLSPRRDVHPSPGGTPSRDGRTIKVLSIQGEGIKAVVVPAMIFAELERRLGKELHQVFDLMSGSSGGRMIALGLGTKSKGDGPYRPDDLVDMYVKNGPKIFRRNFITPVRALFRPRR